MDKKKIVFVSPVGEGGPKVLYKDLISLLSVKYPEYEYYLISSIKGWILLHFNKNKYNLIISSVPFLFKPLNSKYVLNIHGLYRNDRGFSSPGAILNWFYPYNTLFSKYVFYPSKFLLKYCNFNKNINYVIPNFSNFPIKILDQKNELYKKNEINLLTIFRADIYNKAIGILDLYEKLKLFHPNKKINYTIAGFGKYYEEMKGLFDVKELDKNINIKWIGKIDKDGVLYEINKSDIFLYSTFYETFGIILIEVLSLGKPILLSNYDSFHGIYNEEFISKNHYNFIEKLDKLINNDSYYKDYINKGYKNLKNFDKDKISDKWYNLIKEQIK